jgi:hypothetical protein
LSSGKTSVRAVLISLISLDVSISAIAFFRPELWFDLFHGVPYADPEGLLRRTGAAWAGFALFQVLALRRWEREPIWLALVAGIRFSDMFTDWTYLAFAHDLTLFGRISLAAASPLNVIAGIFFIRRCKFFLSKT